MCNNTSEFSIARRKIGFNVLFQPSLVHLMLILKLLEDLKSNLISRIVIIYLITSLKLFCNHL